MDWTSEPWFVLMSLSMGVGAYILSRVIHRIYEERKRTPTQAAARDQLEICIRRVIHANMHLMECVQDTVTACKQMPPEYRAVAEQALRFAQLLEEATFEEGARESLFARPMFSIGLPSLPPPPVPGSEEPPSVTPNVVPIRHEQHNRWTTINGQLMRTG